MLIQNISSSAAQTALTGGSISNDAPKVVARAPTPQPVTQQPSTTQLTSAVQGINDAIQQTHQNLQFSVDSTTRMPVVTLTDSETQQVIAQYPSKEVLAIAASIEQTEKRQGLLHNSKA